MLTFLLILNIGILVYGITYLENKLDQIERRFSEIYQIVLHTKGEVLEDIKKEIQYLREDVAEIGKQTGARQNYTVYKKEDNT